MRKLNSHSIILILIIIVFLIAIFTKDIRIEIAINTNQTANQIVNLEKLENITGNLYMSPDNSWGAFYDSISNIKHSLKLQTYEFTEKNIKAKLKELLGQGVDIKIIMENYKYQQFKNTWKDIENYFTGYENFEIKSDKQMKTEYVHSKINLVDSGFWIQTANLTNSSFQKNREHFFYSENQAVWHSLNNIFDKDREGEKILLSDIHPNLVVCNINCRNVIETLLESAKESILIQTQYIVDERILNILKKEIGTKNIRLIVSDTDMNDKLLNYFGPAISRKFDKYYNHTKMILVDEKILLLGSMNLSDNSLDNNREIGILIIDQELIKKYKELFEIDREKSKY
ncbi:MAG TPA: phospholipase D-like domain-containing protein [Candidatus Absconditabacterales bacterium]|nr:phospholipase D-like domain-containing protein [Candidatus Absconditabacterales bacterium]HPK28310.1 phospholipase D-like domain-containing protein [Candidatus Absconditabacterales bacterium]